MDKGARWAQSFGRTARWDGGLSAQPEPLEPLELPAKRKPGRSAGLGVYLCCSCQGIIVEKKIPKFGSFISINILCQNYPKLRKSLTAVEDAEIARAHPIIPIVMLRLSGFGPSGSYRIRGHTVELSGRTAKVPLPQERRSCGGKAYSGA